MKQATIPEFLAHLPVHAGFPVPFLAAWPDGKPDFRVTDIEKLARCIDEKLCGVCGKELPYWVYYVGGPESRASGHFKDPPMHQACAEWSAQACPFLAGVRPHHSARGCKSEQYAIVADTSVPTVRPPEMYILRGRRDSVSIRSHGDHWHIESGKLFDHKEF